MSDPLSARQPLRHPEIGDRTVDCVSNQLLSRDMSQRTPRGIGELPAYRVVCVDTDLAAKADGHDHVTAIETWDPDGGRTRWTLVQVIAAVRDGEQFHAGKGGDGQAAVLEPAVCPRCPVATLLVDPPEVVLPACG